jgi:hypothetical protein
LRRIPVCGPTMSPATNTAMMTNMSMRTGRTPLPRKRFLQLDQQQRNKTAQRGE